MVIAMPRPQPSTTRPATGDSKLNHVLAGHGKITVNLKVADKVGHKLGAMAKSDPVRAASLISRMMNLEVQGKIKIDGKSSHGLPSNARAALYNPALIELNRNHPNIARQWNLPDDPIALMK